VYPHSVTNVYQFTLESLEHLVSTYKICNNGNREAWSVSLSWRSIVLLQKEKICCRHILFSLVVGSVHDACILYESIREKTEEKREEDEISFDDASHPLCIQRHLTITMIKERVSRLWSLFPFPSSFCCPTFLMTYGISCRVELQQHFNQDSSNFMIVQNWANVSHSSDTRTQVNVRKKEAIRDSKFSEETK
jgi:hypothetical protein